MGRRQNHHTKRKQLRKKLESQGVPEAEIVRRIEVLKARQAEQRANALPEQVEGGCATAEMCTPEVTAVVLCARRYWHDQSGGNRERLGFALEAFDGII